VTSYLFIKFAWSSEILCECVRERERKRKRKRKRKDVIYKYIILLSIFLAF
jgi:hypothetical protein